MHNQGAGQVDIYAALTYGLQQRMTPSAVSLGAGPLAILSSLQHSTTTLHLMDEGWASGVSDHAMQHRPRRCCPSAGYGNGKTVSIRVDNFGGMSSTTYTLTHEGALAELYSTDITAQVRVPSGSDVTFFQSSLRPVSCRRTALDFKPCLQTQPALCSEIRGTMSYVT